MNSNTSGVTLSLKTVFGIQFEIFLLLREKAYLPPVTMVIPEAMVDKRESSEQGLDRVPQLLNRGSCNP
jgi:hypothetical protein